MNKEKKLAMCDGKEQMTRENAQRIAAAMKKRDRRGIGIYKCKACKAWHIGGNK